MSQGYDYDKYWRRPGNLWAQFEGVPDINVEDFYWNRLLYQRLRRRDKPRPTKKEKRQYELQQAEPERQRAMDLIRTLQGFDKLRVF